MLVATSSMFQDQTDLLRRAAVALGHLPVRGLVTTGRAVDPADVPAPANTVRVLRLGAGLRVDKSPPPARIAAAVQQLLHDPSHAEVARRFAGVLAEEERTRPGAADRAEAQLPS